MVIVGGYSVRLIEAVTKTPFKEHKGPDGKFYAKVEPNQEYFIQFEVLKKNDTSDKWQRKFNFEVDGQKLNCCFIRNATSGKSYTGLRSRVGDTSIHQALCFRKPKFEQGRSKPQSYRPLGGSVRVRITEAICSGTKLRKDRDSCDTFVQGTRLLSTLQGHGHGKLLRSAEGKHIESKRLHRISNFKDEYISGEVLQVITINYCTATGLVQAGVLLPTLRSVVKSDSTSASSSYPSDTHHSSKRSCSSNSDTSADEEIPMLSVVPKKFKVEGIVRDGIMLAQPREYELFDLTNE